MNKQEMIDKAEEAKRIMENPLIVDFFDRVDQQLFERWKGAALGTVEERETLNLQQIGLTAFKEFMHKTLVDGQMALRDIEEG